MTETLGPRRIVRESVPLAAIVLLWTVLSVLASHPLVGQGLSVAGIAVGLLYALRRGADLAGTASGLARDTRGLLEQSLRIALPALVWFLLARALFLLRGLWDQLALPGAFVSPAETLGFALTVTGVLTVVLQAVAIGLAGSERVGDTVAIPVGEFDGINID